MSKNEKIALLGYILFMVAFVASDSIEAKITALFFSAIAAYQFICPTKRAADGEVCTCVGTTV